MRKSMSRCTQDAVLLGIVLVRVNMSTGLLVTRMLAIG